MTKKKTQWKFLKHNGTMHRKYKVSNHGEIVHSNDMTPLPQHDMQKKSPLNGSDYQAVSIPGVCKGARVHRIVCETFHGKAPAGKNLVNHVDEFKDNNITTNLEWVSPSENLKAYYANHPSVKYTRAKISQVKRLINKGWTNDRIAQKVKMSDSNVSCIKLGRTHNNIEPFIIG